MSTISKRYNKKANRISLRGFDRETSGTVFLGIAFFFLTALGTQDSIKTVVLIAAVCALLAVAARFRLLTERITVPFLALTLYVIMDGASTFYAISGKFALREFLKVFLAYLLALILLATSAKKETPPGRRIAAILAVCTALGSLVSLDQISTRWISGVVMWILERFTQTYEGIKIAFPMDRLESLFGNANVFGGFSGLGILLSLGLADISDSKKERALFLVLLYLNALAFLLANNRGASVILVLAVLIYVAVTVRQKGAHHALTLLAALVLTIVSAMVVTRTSFRTYRAHQPIPLLCAALGSAALCFVDLLIAKLSFRRAREHRKLPRFAGGAIILAVVLLAAAALSVTGGITLDKKGSLSRNAFARAGHYELDLTSDGQPLSVIVTSQSKQEIMLKRSTTLYSGDAYQASFDVPEGSVQLRFLFSAPQGAQISAASFGGHKIPLRYALLPSFIVTRLHSSTAFYSAVQRLVYFEDGMKLFRRSPIVGLGMGAFENGIKSVQTYYYETKYAHNHYFQTMVETGVVGLLLFLGLLASSAAAVWKARKTQPLAPVLGACLVFMAGQALTDVVFSAYAYLPVAYGVFAAISLGCGDAIARPKLGKVFRAAAIGVIMVCTAVYCFFLGGNMLARRQASENHSLATLVQSANLDRFEWTDYALSYVVNFESSEDDPEEFRQADEFAGRLAEVNSNTIPIYLAEYYFKTDRPEQAFAMLEKYVDYVSSDQSAWRSAFDLLRDYADGSEPFRIETARLAEKLARWNEENLGDIQLDQEEKDFIAEYTGQEWQEDSK